MNIWDKYGMTPLMKAAYWGQLGAARMLVVDVGVDTTLTNTGDYDGSGKTGLTTAQWARERGHVEVAEFLDHRRCKRQSTLSTRK